MAILWEATRAGVRYEVRSAGRTRRLYTDGVLHTQYHPQRPVTGSVWDLLLLPAFFLPAGELRQVLVLGVGGGAVINLLRHYFSPDCITGIELSDIHLRLGRRFFGLQRRGIHLIQADAVDWLAGYTGEPFDLIIDDLFMEVEGEPARAVYASPAWLRLLDSHLSRRGALVMNFATRGDFHRCGFFARPGLQRRFASAMTFSHPQLENCIAAWMKQPASTRWLRRRIQSLALPAQLKQRLLQYRVQGLPPVGS